MSLQLSFEPPPAYAWHTSDGRTTLLTGRTASVPFVVGKDHKITFYSRGKHAFENMGTAIFNARQYSDKKCVVRAARWKVPALESIFPHKGTAEESVTITIVGAICEDTTEQYRVGCRKAISEYGNFIYSLKNDSSLNTRPGCPGEYKGFSRISQFEYEWPFCVPGVAGIPQVGTETHPPSTIEKYVQHAALLCEFDADAFHSAGRESQERSMEALFSLSATSAAFANGYECETVDDTSSVWVALGGDKDCEDFAVETVSTINALKTCKTKTMGRLASSICEFARNRVKRAFIISGWYEHKPGKFIGHAWCCVDLYKASYGGPLRMYLECTSPTLPHGNTDVYGGALRFTKPPFTAPEGSYGPAKPIKVEKYSVACFAFTDSETFCIGESPDNVGATAQSMMNGTANFTKVDIDSVCSTESKKALNICRQLMHRPDFALLAGKVQNIIKDTPRRAQQELCGIETQKELIQAPSYIIPAKAAHKLTTLPPNATVSIFRLTPYTECYVIYANTAFSTLCYTE